MKHKLTAILIAISLVLSLAPSSGAADVRAINKAEQAKEVIIIEEHVFEIVYSESADSREDVKNININVFPSDEEASRFLDEKLASNADGEFSAEGLEVFNQLTPDDEEPVTPRGILCWLVGHVPVTVMYTVVHHIYPGDRINAGKPCHETTYTQVKCSNCDYAFSDPVYISHVNLPNCKH